MFYSAQCCRFTCFFVLFYLIVPFAHAENILPQDAVSYEVGQGWVSHGVDEFAQNRWFVFRENAQRSYCIEAAMGAATYFPLEPDLTLYQNSAGSVPYLVSDKSKITDPPMNRGARICYPSPLAIGQSILRAVKINVPVAAGSGQNGFVRLRVVDTSYVSPVFQAQKNVSNRVDGYTVFSLNNITASPVKVTFSLQGYGFLGDMTIPAATRSSLLLGKDIKSTTYFISGMLHVIHDGPPGALEGSRVESINMVNYYNDVLSNQQYSLPLISR